MPKLLSFLTLLLFTICSYVQAQEGMTDGVPTAQAQEAVVETVVESATGEPATETVAVEKSAKPLGAKYLCELQGLTRRVEIDYESTGSSIPCSVYYYKDSEAPGEVNTLWNATNIEGYCEDKAKGFIERLKSWGWSCTDG